MLHATGDVIGARDTPGEEILDALVIYLEVAQFQPKNNRGSLLLLNGGEQLLRRQRDEAIDALSSPDAKPALVTDLFAAHFKAAATSAAAKQGKEVELPAAALAELNDELAALAKRDGYDGPVAKMPAKVAA